jgi:hypothetical protein
MTAPKIVAQTTSCGKCPHYTYYSGGTYHCALVEERVMNKEQVAPFCPLPDYPSQTIAKMEVTIESLREPNKHGFNIAFLSHMASKLKVRLEPSCRGIHIPLKDGTEVFLDPDWVTNIAVSPCVIEFRFNDKLYTLHPDALKPVLYRQYDKDPSLYEECHLA